MEIHVPLSTPLGDLDAVRQSVYALDPSAVVDTARDGRTLRIAGTLGPLDLAWTLRRAGVPVTADDLVVQASVCCGGCSG